MKLAYKILLALIFTIFFSQYSKACMCGGGGFRNPLKTLENTKEFALIALVKVTGEYDLPKENNTMTSTTGVLKIDILELFQGEPVNQILEGDKYSSCDMGVSVGEEWIMLGHYVNGHIVVHLCGGNQRYREANGLRPWKSDFELLNKLKLLYNHQDAKAVDGKKQAFYTNGKLEFEEEYQNGMRNGKRIIWYPNGLVYCKQNYVNGLIDGKSEWFYPSGQLSNEDYYIKGKPSNSSRVYYDTTEHPIDDPFFLPKNMTLDSLKQIYHKIQTYSETVYNSEGEQILFRIYKRTGRINWERISYPQFYSTTWISYYHNGSVKSIQYYKNNCNYGHYQSYTTDGLPNSSWDYDECGNIIPLSIIKGDPHKEWENSSFD